jgi:hypothetical protein
LRQLSSNVAIADVEHTKISKLSDVRERASQLVVGRIKHQQTLGQN